MVAPAGIFPAITNFSTPRRISLLATGIGLIFPTNRCAPAPLLSGPWLRLGWKSVLSLEGCSGGIVTSAIAICAIISTQARRQPMNYARRFIRIPPQKSPPPSTWRQSVSTCTNTIALTTAPGGQRHVYQGQRARIGNFPIGRSASGCRSSPGLDRDPPVLRNQGSPSAETQDQAQGEPEIGIVRTKMEVPMAI